MTRGKCVFCGTDTACYFKLANRMPVHACIPCMKADITKIDARGLHDRALAAEVEPRPPATAQIIRKDIL